MAKVVLGMGSSHGPMLSTPPDMWHLRGDADRKNPKHFYRGEAYDFAKLLAARQPGFADKITPEERKKRYDACQRALDKLAAKFREVSPDAVVIVGNDQRELFRDDNTPALLVFTGSKVQNIPETEEAKAKFPPGIAIAEAGHCPPGGAEYAGSPDLGVHLVKSLIDQEFDVSESAHLPKTDGHEHGIPHAFGFLYRRIMVDQPPPNVPVFLNAGIPNNRPKVGRCLKFGRALMKAIESWKEDAKVAVFCSGGLTHFVIDEDLDQRVLKAMKDGDEGALATVSETYLLGNTCEIRNWLPLSSGMNALGRKMTIVDYVPCYRTEAGTGNAMGFVYWQ
jgi:Catalytic LigB subunit of aromatic ring-opening dioxygenase